MFAYLLPNKQTNKCKGEKKMMLPKKVGSLIFCVSFFQVFQVGFPSLAKSSGQIFPAKKKGPFCQTNTDSANG